MAPCPPPHPTPTASLIKNEATAGVGTRQVVEFIANGIERPSILCAPPPGTQSIATAKNSPKKKKKKEKSIGVAKKKRQLQKPPTPIATPKSTPALASVSIASGGGGGRGRPPRRRRPIRAPLIEPLTEAPPPAVSLDVAPPPPSRMGNIQCNWLAAPGVATPFKVGNQKSTAAGFARTPNGKKKNKTKERKLEKRSTSNRPNHLVALYGTKRTRLDRHWSKTAPNQRTP